MKETLKIKRNTDQFLQQEQLNRTKWSTVFWLFKNNQQIPRLQIISQFNQNRYHKYY